MEIFADGKVISLDDYKSLTVVGERHAGWKSSSAQKGQLEELQAVAETLRRDGPWPIPLDEQIQATKISLEVERRITNGSGAMGSPACAE